MRNLLLMLMVVFIGCASAEMNMPQTTILKSTQPSEENWQPQFSQKVVRALQQSAIRGFTLKVKPTRSDSFNIGAMKSKAVNNSERNRDDNGNGKYFVGLRYTKRF